MASNSLPHLTQKGLWAISIGFSIVNGKRTQRKHWLGRDKALAIRKSKALYIAWEGETAVDGEDKKVWTQATINAALAFAAPASSAPPPASAPVAVQLVPSLPVPPPSPVKTYTVLAALDEYVEHNTNRSDIGHHHVDGTEQRTASI